MSRLGQIDLWVADEPVVLAPHSVDVVDHIEALADLVEELGERVDSIRHELWFIRMSAFRAQEGAPWAGSSMSSPYHRSA